MRVIGWLKEGWCCLADVPDATSSLSCVPLSLRLGEVARCTFVPRRASVQIYALRGAVVPARSPSAGALGAVEEAFANVLHFNYAADASASGPVVVSSGVFGVSAVTLEVAGGWL